MLSLSFSCRRLEATASRFVSCPCCGRSVAMALLDDHLDMCGRAPEEPSADPAANGGSTCHEAQGATVGQLPPVPAPAAPATPASSVWGGLRVAQTQSQLSSAAAAAETSQQAALLPQTQATCCPACGKQMLFAFLNAHLDSGECGEPEPEPTPTTIARRTHTWDWRCSVSKPASAACTT